MENNTIKDLIGVDGKRICFLGNLSHKKNYQMLIYMFYEIWKYDSDFTLHCGGRIDEMRASVTLDWLINEYGMQGSVAHHGYIDDVDNWLKNFDFCINTSPWEGMCVSVLQSLKQGLTPILWNSVGITDIYPRDFIFKDVSELLEIIKKGPQDPHIYKQFVEENFSKEKQMQEIGNVVKNLLKDVGAKREEEKKESTVSCVIAVKNGAKTIRNTIDSLIVQTKKLEKIIVVDDSSTDDLTLVLNQYNTLSEKDNPKIVLVRNKVSQWVFSARNEGFKYVDTDYFFFLDADDFVDEHYVEKLSKVLDENSAISVVYPDLVYFDENDNERVYKQPEFSVQLLMQQNYIAYSSMQRTSAFKKIGGFSDYMNDCRNHMTEWALWLNYVKNGYGFKHYLEPLFHYFHDESSDQMSMRYERTRDDMSFELALNISDDWNEIQMLGDRKKIVLVCQGKDYMQKSEVGFELFQLYYPLTEFGNVYTFQYDVEMKHFGVDEMNKRLFNFLDVIKPDYVFHFTYKMDILPTVWKQISEKYCTICWNSDDDRRFENYSKEYGKNFRYSVTTYPKIYAIMDHPGRILSQWAANQYYFRPVPDQKVLDVKVLNKTIDCVFIGQKYGNREEMLKGLPVKKYGAGWDNGFLSFPKMAETLALSKIAVNFASGADGRKQLKLRPFEVCACNTLCLTENMPDLEKYYLPNKEIVVFDGKRDLEVKIEYYLKHEEERKKIAQAGYNKTVSQHLWSHRLKDIFKVIEKGLMQNPVGNVAKEDEQEEFIEY